MKPVVSILDPELTYTIPIKQTAYSAADIVSHLLEHYLATLCLRSLSGSFLPGRHPVPLWTVWTAC